ncbi:MAG: hypothetical protein V4534_06465 [Myxococcota bacterium]
MYKLTYFFAILTLGAGFAFAEDIILNPGFETGSLSDWTISDDLVGRDAQVVVKTNTNYIPVGGEYFAAIPAGCRDNSIRQSFEAVAGDQIQIWTYFEPVDSMPYNDSGSIILEFPNNDNLQLFYGDVLTGNSGWTLLNYTFTLSGTYAIVANSHNEADCNFPSVLGLDKVVYISNGTVNLPDTADYYMLFKDIGRSSSSNPKTNRVALKNDDFDIDNVYSIKDLSDVALPTQIVYGTSTVNINNRQLQYNVYPLSGSYSNNSKKVKFENIFETLNAQYTISRPTTLLAPTSVGSTTPGVGSYYVCYDINQGYSHKGFDEKGPAKGSSRCDYRHGKKYHGLRYHHDDLDVTLANSAITPALGYDLRKATQFCVPVNVKLSDGTVLESNQSAQNNLVCYDIQRRSSLKEYVSVLLTDQFISETVKFKSDRELCVPTKVLDIEDVKTRSHSKPSCGDNDDRRNGRHGRPSNNGNHGSWGRGWGRK